MNTSNEIKLTKEEAEWIRRNRAFGAGSADTNNGVNNMVAASSATTTGSSNVFAGPKVVFTTGGGPRKLPPRGHWANTGVAEGAAAPMTHTVQGGKNAPKKKRSQRNHARSGTAAHGIGIPTPTPKRGRSHIKGDTPTESTPKVKKPKAKQNPVLSTGRSNADATGSGASAIDRHNGGDALQGHGSFADAVKTSCLNLWLVSSSGNIQETNLNSIKNRIRPLILKEIDNRGKPPVFDKFELSEGKVAVACADNHSKQWLEANVQHLNGIIKDATFTVYEVSSLPKKPKPETLCIMFQSVKENLKDMLRLLRSQNTGLSTNEWKVWGKTRVNNGVRYTFGVDRATIEWVKTHKMAMYYGTDKVKCTLPAKKKTNAIVSSEPEPPAMETDEAIPKMAEDTVAAPHIENVGEDREADAIAARLKLAETTRTTVTSAVTPTTETMCVNLTNSCQINSGTAQPVTNTGTGGEVQQGI